MKPAPGVLNFQTVTLNYIGTGVGTGVNLLFAANNGGQGYFAGAFDNLVVQRAAQWAGAASGNWSTPTNWVESVAP